MTKTLIGDQDLGPNKLLVNGLVSLHRVSPHVQRDVHHDIELIYHHPLLDFLRLSHLHTSLPLRVELQGHALHSLPSLQAGGESLDSRRLSLNKYLEIFRGAMRTNQKSPLSQVILVGVVTNQRK